ncbi:hypothetical protein NDU88_003922 [Pleurodeles waltl]|uniref:Uncharacterized protein n=1 Tax=Pleurodeles waltl TaxID=8319 RepID=A0AAV7LPG9_PLEWA|nr:hypothetical protein NDU88_003922 [Pleurodeles waltl]
MGGSLPSCSRPPYPALLQDPTRGLSSCPGPLLPKPPQDTPFRQKAVRQPVSSQATCCAYHVASRPSFCSAESVATATRVKRYPHLLASRGGDWGDFWGILDYLPDGVGLPDDLLMLYLLHPCYSIPQPTLIAGSSFVLGLMQRIVGSGQQAGQEPHNLLGKAYWHGHSTLEEIMALEGSFRDSNVSSQATSFNASTPNKLDLILTEIQESQTSQIKIDTMTLDLGVIKEDQRKLSKGPITYVSHAGNHPLAEDHMARLIDLVNHIRLLCNWAPTFPLQLTPSSPHTTFSGSSYGNRPHLVSSYAPGWQAHCTNGNCLPW